MKKIIALFMTAIVMLSMAACGTQKSSNGSGSEQKSVTLKLAHNLNEQHPVHLALAEFAKKVEEKTNGQVKIQIFPNGQLGSESEVLEQLQAGAVALTKVSATALTTYEDGYNAFSLPYVFNDENHFYKCMESDVVKELYNKTKDKGFIGLTYYDSGARSFYTAKKAINTPQDLKGLKIRVMGFKSQTDMMQALGGTAVSMNYGDVYTALQSGVIDGCENNETALTIGKHGEVAKYFSYDEHTRIPDILVISSKVWDSLTADQQKAIQEAAKDSTEFQKPLWKKSVQEAVEQAKSMGVKFNDVDKKPFKEAVAPMIEKYSNEMIEVKKLLDAFKTIQ
ncbi:tripartite ATP-independent transporter solute receptor, DctP family [Caloramator quimbayensis]|uniref:Tripartite ATP-independent transporter solute receptor, DctP family n=1 Tax=Caloramator quimbayensis TaxID=1147123 RepID=A0A1T4WHQ4_9CLOT|nr:TRAP transporter substrate-binding protein [Caloramator quimbayensis]SKA76435.1 tripartite ATP-independent transporter solute receptor, DctP family [Caloramator quimbayensis]